MDKLYRDLVDLPGAPSFEKPVRDYMRKFLTPHVDEIIEDRLGSIFGVINKGSEGPRVMIAGHMDEVGAIVTGIDKKTIISQSFITPSCGTGSLDLDSAKKVLKLTKEVSDAFRLE